MQLAICQVRMYLRGAFTPPESPITSHMSFLLEEAQKTLSHPCLYIVCELAQANQKVIHFIILLKEGRLKLSSWLLPTPGSSHSKMLAKC